MPQPSPESFIRIKQALLGKTGKQLMDFILSLKLHQKPNDIDGDITALARQLKWISKPPNGGIQLTTSGELAGDSIREYISWKERNKKIHAQIETSHFSTDRLQNKEILEIGCGFGCNLFSLHKISQSCTGLEIEPYYTHLAKIFAEIEGIPYPDIIIGQGEELPFPEEQFDVVLILGSLQYTDIKKSIAESERVLKPGGHLITIQSTFGQFISNLFYNTLRQRNIRNFVKDICTCINTIFYQVTDKRMALMKKKFSTNQPVYPTQKYIKSLIRNVGMQPTNADKENLKGETVFVAQKTE